MFPDIKVVGTKVTITFDASKAGTPSKSGKSEVVATTSGNKPIPGTDLILGLNAYRRKAA